MVKNPELFRALSDHVEDAVVESSKILWDAGVDFLWFSDAELRRLLYFQKNL